MIECVKLHGGNLMASVTQRVSQVKQPFSGYIKPSEFDKIQLKDNIILFPFENISASTVGIAVDYLTRLAVGQTRDNAFQVSLAGAEVCERLTSLPARAMAYEYLNKITGLDDNSIINTVMLVRNDVWLRNPESAIKSLSSPITIPSKETIANIRTMVNRGLNLFSTYGPITSTGFTFEPYGYTSIITSGDGDFLTKDTMWNFKVSKRDITSKHTLQILIYYVMGKHSGNNIFRSINKIGFFNPRLNRVYKLDIQKIPESTIQKISRDVIGYT